MTKIALPVLNLELRAVLKSLAADIATGVLDGKKIINLDVGNLTAGTIRSKTITLAVTDGSGDAYIAAGKTDFTNVESGFILGLDDSDSNKVKFYIGDSSDYLNWDGSTLTIRGSLNADDISAGTLTGRTIRTSDLGGATGRAVQIVGGSNQDVGFYYNGVLKAFIGGYVDGDGVENEYLKIQADSGRRLRFMESKIECDADFVPDADKAQDMGKPAKRWNNSYTDKVWQSTNTDGSRHCYDFAYIEMNLLPKKLIEKRTAKDGLMSPNGYVPGLKLPFKQGTVLKWTGRGLKECTKETDFAVAIADEDGLPIILGAEPVRVVGKTRIGDYIIPSKIPGCAIASKRPGDNEVIGRCLENKKDEGEKLIKVIIKF